MQIITSSTPSRAARKTLLRTSSNQHSSFNSSNNRRRTSSPRWLQLLCPSRARPNPPSKHHFRRLLSPQQPNLLQPTRLQRLKPQQVTHLLNKLEAIHSLQWWALWRNSSLQTPSSHLLQLQLKLKSQFSRRQLSNLLLTCLPVHKSSTHRLVQRKSGHRITLTITSSASLNQIISTSWIREAIRTLNHLIQLSNKQLRNSSLTSSHAASFPVMQQIRCRSTTTS